jgi:hypothetical protein
MSNEVLWAPWRLAYIEKPAVNSGDGKGTGDIFVDLPAEQDDAKNYILYRGEVAFVMLNAFPYTNGHLLIAPYRQVAEIDLLDDAELLEINQLLARAARWLKRAYRPDGMNIGVNMGRAAGAGTGAAAGRAGAGAAAQGVQQPRQAGVQARTLAVQGRQGGGAAVRRRQQRARRGAQRG